MIKCLEIGKLYPKNVETFAISAFLPEQYLENYIKVLASTIVGNPKCGVILNTSMGFPISLKTISLVLETFHPEILTCFIDQQNFSTMPFHHELTNAFLEYQMGQFRLSISIILVTAV